MSDTTTHLPRADRRAAKRTPAPVNLTPAGARQAAELALEALGAPPRPWATITPTGRPLRRYAVTYGTGRFTAAVGSLHLTHAGAMRSMRRFLDRAHKLERLGVSLARPEAGR